MSMPMSSHATPGSYSQSLREREDLLDPRAHAVLEQGPLALGQLLLLLRAL
jgi:hypothetical protein